MPTEFIGCSFVQMKKYIHKNKYYSAKSILSNEWLPWIKSLPTVTEWIQENAEYLKPIIRESKSAGGKRYYIKGEYLIEFLKKIEKKGLVVKAENDTR